MKSPRILPLFGDWPVLCRQHHPKLTAIEQKLLWGTSIFKGFSFVFALFPIELQLAHAMVSHNVLPSRRNDRKLPYRHNQNLCYNLNHNWNILTQPLREKMKITNRNCLQKLYKENIEQSKKAWIPSRGIPLIRLELHPEYSRPGDSNIFGMLLKKKILNFSIYLSQKKNSWIPRAAGLSCVTFLSNSMIFALPRKNKYFYWN